MRRTTASRHEETGADAQPVLPWHLRRDIIGLLLLKAAALTLLYFLFFGPSYQASQTPEAVGAHILSQTSQSTH